MLIIVFISYYSNRMQYFSLVISQLMYKSNHCYYHRYWLSPMIKRGIIEDDIDIITVFAVIVVLIIEL